MGSLQYTSNLKIVYCLTNEPAVFSAPPLLAQDRNAMFPAMQVLTLGKPANSSQKYLACSVLWHGLSLKIWPAISRIFYNNS